MFGKLRRANASASVPAAEVATRGAPSAWPIASPVPVAFYQRKPAYHTARKAAITRLHVEHTTLARLNNAMPAPRPDSLAARPIARAAATAPGRPIVVAPPAPGAAARPLG